MAIANVSFEQLISEDWGNSVADLLNSMQPTAWVTVSAFTNSWVAESPAPRYRRIGDQVYLDGVVTGGALISSAFTLPVGFRPSRALQMQCAANNGNTPTMVIIDTGGLVQPWVGSATRVQLNFNFSTV